MADPNASPAAPTSLPSDSFATPSLPDPSPLPKPPSETIQEQDPRFNLTFASPVVQDPAQQRVQLGQVEDVGVRKADAKAKAKAKAKATQG
ncbi:hypothetical protein HDU85_003734 [Gaertneriomyces sp. JEL0708]|nr:hypothetical protein HDU85_003734 [Gaertneriomyces sp. JEL0708]